MANSVLERMVKNSMRQRFGLTGDDIKDVIELLEAHGRMFVGSMSEDLDGGFLRMSTGAKLAFKLLLKEVDRFYPQP